MVCGVVLSVALYGFSATAQHTITQALDQVGAVTGNSFVIDASGAGADLEIWNSPYRWRSRTGETLAFTAGSHIEVYGRQFTKATNGWQGGAALGPVLLHELGHAWDLPHSTSPTSIMQSSVDASSPTEFSKADKAALAAGCRAH